MSTLAIDGGTPVRSAPFPLRRLMGPDEQAALNAMFDRAEAEGHGVFGYNGPEEDAYCSDFAASLGGGYADAVNSGSNAVWVALRSLELEPLGEVIVPAVSDPGGVMPVALANQLPVPADCARGSYNVGVDQIAARIGPGTRAIIVAHIAGSPADMDPIVALASSKGIPVIEDCAQAHGARYKGRPVGTSGDIAVFSTMFGKHHMTGGQGGVVFTRDEARYWAIRRHADRGKPFGIENPTGNVVPALNCNMDELHAAIGRVQLAKLPEVVRRRRAIARSVIDACARDLTAVSVIDEPPQTEASFWFMLIRIDPARLKVDRDTFCAALRSEGIPVSPGYPYIPARSPWATDPRSYAPGLLASARTAPADWPLPNIEATDSVCMQLMFHEDWTQADADDVVAALAKVQAAYLK